MSDEPLYNSRIVNTYVKFVRKSYPHADIDRALASAGMTAAQVNDEGHWFTQRQINLWHENLVQLTGNAEISREAGRFAASSDALGLVKKYVLGLIGPAHSFGALKVLSASFTRSALYESRRLSSNSVEVTVTPRPDVRESPFQCLNRVGFFEALLACYDHELPAIEHTECIFEGGSCCRYVIKWKKTLPLKLRTARNVLFFLLPCAALLPGQLASWQVLAQALPMLGFILVGLGYLADELEKKDLYRSLLSQRDSATELLSHVQTNYNNALMVNEVGQAISTQTEIDEVLEKIVRTLENRLGFDRCLIMLASPDKSRLEFCTGFGYTSEQLTILKATSFNLADRDSRGIFVTCYRDRQPVLIDDFSLAAPSLSPDSLELARKMDSHAFICCAIVCEGESLGILAVDNCKSKKPLTQSDKSLVMGVAPVIGISIRNAKYIERERRLGDQLRQSQKMEAVGQLAGGVAHDFNNLLTAIIGFTTLAQMQSDDDHVAQPYLQQILLAADRATQLTQGLLSFSRKQTANPQPVELNGIVRGIEKLLRRLISADIDLQLSLGIERLPVVADIGQIDQIVMNLATNARDAMARGGTLVIATSRLELTAAFVSERGFGKPGAHALLSVRDTGIGMDEGTKAHACEPFFTTKEPGKGTGLGLAIVYGNVKQHNGYLEIDSAPGRGTTFNIYLPLIKEEPAQLRLVESAKPRCRGTETVLVVEDATEVRKLTREVLEQSGYRVIEAVDGVDAVEKLAAHAEEVQLVIMDVVMPRMSGKEAFAEILKMRPELKVIFTSGYTRDDVDRRGIRPGADNFLSKPSAPQDLLEKVREVLAA